MTRKPVSAFRWISSIHLFNFSDAANESFVDAGSSDLNLCGALRERQLEETIWRGKIKTFIGLAIGFTFWDGRTYPVVRSSKSKNKNKRQTLSNKGKLKSEKRKRLRVFSLSVCVCGAQSSALRLSGSCMTGGSASSPFCERVTTKS